MLDKLLKFDCTNNGFRRPEFLSVRINALENIMQLIGTRPKKTLKFIPENVIEDSDDE